MIVTIKPVRNNCVAFSNFISVIVVTIKKQKVSTIKNFSLFLFLTVVSHVSFGQVIHEKSNEDVKIFSPDQATNETDTIPSLKSVIHFGLLHPLRGRYPLFFEQAFSGHIGLSAGIGITHADFFRSEHSNIIFNPGNGKMNIGFHSEILTKVYFSGLAIEDYYVGLNGKFSTFNYDEYKDTYVNAVQEKHYEALLIGGVQFGELDHLLVYDYYVGIGISNIYTTDQETVNIGGEFTPIDLESERGFSAILRVGVKIGIKVK